MKPYNVERAFAEIEEELIASMIRNMKRHRVEEVAEGKEWSMWQAEQLKALRAYKKKNKTRFSDRFKAINKQIEKAIIEARTQGNMDEEIKILEAIKKGFTGYRKTDASVVGEFFKANDRKLDALIKATQKDFQRGERAILRMAEDQYRQIIFNAQVYANTGAGTYEQAVDMATKDFLSRGINCIEYKNGARHTMKDYADMAIRTAAKRAYLAGEGEKRAEWGISTVIVNKRGNACPKCVPFVGKVLIDDVYSSGSKKDGDYPLLSRAIELGFLHPRCKDTFTTYFPGVSTADDKWTKKELEVIGEDYKQEQKQIYAKRQAERFGRMAKHSLDPENKKKYLLKHQEWDKAERLRNNMPRDFVDTRNIGEPIAKEKLFRFIEKAKEKGIRISDEPSVFGGFKKYCGDPKVLDELLDNLEKSMIEARNKNLYDGDVILRYDNVLGYQGDNSMVDIGAFAETKGHTITLNKFMFDDSAYLAKEYAEAVNAKMFSRGN